MRFAYADPPYPGTAHLYKDHPDYAGEVDHKALIERLVAEYPDGWALSTSASALRQVLSACPDDIRILIWHIPDAFCLPQQKLRYSWQPIIRYGGRNPSKHVYDLLTAVISDVPPPMRFVGRKPEPFCFWLFRCLGALPGDSLDDLFPGSGAVYRAWEKYQRQLSFIHSEEDYSGKKVKLPI